MKKLVLFLVILQSLSIQVTTAALNVNINTDTASIFIADGSAGQQSTINGILSTKWFVCRNKFNWTYTISSFTLDDATKRRIFETDNRVVINGSNSLEIIATGGELNIDTVLNLSGVALGNERNGMRLGAFALNTTKCCYVGAGPGAAMTFHGGGHGGNGGGSWQDFNGGFYYGKKYVERFNLIGGSTGAIVYDSNPGTGGGAIRIIAKGNLTLGPRGKILANGYTVRNTSHPACSGGSAGGRIVLHSDEKMLLQGVLSANGGSSGKTSNFSDYCGDGGGGGIIILRATELDRSAGSIITVLGGRGLENGMPGNMSINCLADKINGTCTNFSSVSPSTSILTATSSYNYYSSTAAPVHSYASSVGQASKAASFVPSASLIHPSASLIHPSPSPASKYRGRLFSYSSVIRGTVTPARPGVSAELEPLLNVTVTSESALNISKDLADALMSMQQMTAEDTDFSLGILHRIALNPSNSTRDAEDVTKNMLDSCNKIAEITFWGEQYNTSSTVVPQLTHILEKHGHQITPLLKPNDTLLVERDSITFEVTKLDNRKPTERTFPVSTTITSSKDTVVIPKEVFAASSSTTVVTVLMRTNNTYNNSFTVDRKKIRVASDILAVSLSLQNPHKPLPRPITLNQKLSIQAPSNKIVKGGFWKKDSRNKGKSGWSYHGCTSTQRKDGIMKTECNHMTSFAVLMSVKEIEISEDHKTALSYITYIGCGVSLLGLLLTFATFVTLDSLDAERTAIHTNLVVALSIAQIIYLAGIGATQNKIGCTCVAVLLHYFFTAAFSWMLAEGIHLYHKVVRVFNHGSKLKFYYVIGWGLPVVIVALAAGIRSDGYGTEQACWISMEGGLIWAFVAPVVVVIIINFIVLVIVVKILMSSVSAVQIDIHTDNKSLVQIKAGAKAMIILMPILGLSWLFGLLAVNKHTLVFQYLFCIFNSLQGLFIFLIHCVGNTEVRSAFKRLHEKHTLSKSVGERSSAPKSIAKEDVGQDILIRRRTNSSLGSSFNGGDRTATPKTTLSAGQISLNSLNCPTPNEGFYDDEH